MVCGTHGLRGVLLLCLGLSRTPLGWCLALLPVGGLIYYLTGQLLLGFGPPGLWGVPLLCLGLSGTPPLAGYWLLPGVAVWFVFFPRTG